MAFDGCVATPANRYSIKSEAGTAVTADCSPASKVIHHLPTGTIVVCAEVRADDDGADRVRISSPAGWVSAEDLEPAVAAPRHDLDFATFSQRHLTVAPGDHYGLEFPFTIEALREFGPAFLTAAFKAAGSISEDNEVTEIVELKRLGIQGASENAFLTVAYAKAEPGLDTALFVKFPPADPGHKFGLARMSCGEVDMMRLSRERTLPVEMAKYYFGDHCDHTTNYILITERIRFGEAPIEPAYRKGYDQYVPEIDEHYQVLAKAIARLVAAHKAGTIGHDLENIFPFARAARDFAPIENAEALVDRLIDFISRVAPHLFVPETTTPAFLARWRKDVLFGLEHKDAVIAYLHKNVDYTGLCHPNLNVDNAWFWRDESDQLHAGLLDWGGAGQMSIAQALDGMVMMPDPKKYTRLRHDLIAAFIGEYAAISGVALDVDELTLQCKAGIYSTAICTILTIIVDALSLFPEETYKGMKDIYDDTLQSTGMVAAIIWIDNTLREWLEDVTPGDACRRIVALSN